MSQVLDRLMSVAQNPYQYALEDKKVPGKKLVGCAPMHFPEELIHASGARIMLLQESEELISTGYAFMYPNYCGLVRSVVDLCVKGKLNFFDALIIPNTCLQIWAAANLLRKNLLGTRVEFLQLPSILDKPDALSETIEKFRRCATVLEELTGEKITGGKIAESVRIYNRNRRLMTELYNLRRQKPGILGAVEFRAIIQSSMVMPKEEHNRLLEQLLVEHEGKRSPEKKGVREKVPVLLSGNLCQAPKTDILRLIEDLGGMVVDDDLYAGRRYFTGEVEEKGYPLESLARRYVNLPVPCPTRASPQNTWGRYLADAVRDSRARGIIVLLVKYCEPHMFYYPDLSEALKESGIPHILIETEHELVSLENIRTRVQAFMEMI